jgi:hypothetical protein
MEVYMFRLLLEWARIVDDRREELGFDLDGFLKSRQLVG